MEEADSASPASPAAPAHTNTNFFIDDILRPDFGSRRGTRPGACSGAARVDPSADTELSKAERRGSEKRGAALKCTSEKSPPGKDARELLWPAWVYCTRYSDRPSSGPRTRKLKKKRSESEDKRGRTAFTVEQLHRLKAEFQASRYVTEPRRRALAHELRLNEAQIKIWFQNKRAKLKKASGFRDGLAVQLMEQGLYNHSTTTVQEEEDDE